LGLHAAEVTEQKHEELNVGEGPGISLPLGTAAVRFLTKLGDWVDILDSPTFLIV
jgi:hypothetical protein